MNIDAIESFENVDLNPYFDNTIDSDILLKNYLLLTKIDNSIYAILKKDHLAEGLNSLAKLPIEAKVAFLDDESYERLYHKYLERKNESKIDESFSEEEELLEEELSLSEFLKTNSDILTSEESAPVIKFVNSLFYQAIKKRASDIHIEVHENQGVVRFRIDGVLVNHTSLDKHIVNLVINRIKVISNLDISEKRVPQDGRTIVK